MTKKDYEAIAAEIRNVRSGYPSEDAQNALESFCTGLTIYLAHDNPQFSRMRFLAACRGEDSRDSAGRTVRYGKSVDQTSINSPKTGEACGCRLGVERDNCPQCEGTGQRIDFRAIHAAREARNAR